MVPLLVASRSPWNCLSKSMRPMAAPPAFSSGGWGAILTSKGPVAWRGASFVAGAGMFGLVWDRAGMAVKTIEARQAALMKAETPVEEGDMFVILRGGSRGYFLSEC